MPFCRTVTTPSDAVSNTNESPFDRPSAYPEPTPVSSSGTCSSACSRRSLPFAEPPRQCSKDALLALPQAGPASSGVGFLPTVSGNIVGRICYQRLNQCPRCRRVSPSRTPVAQVCITGTRRIDGAASSRRCVRDRLPVDTLVARVSHGTERKHFWRWSERTWQAPDLDPASVPHVTVGIDVGSVSSQAVMLADGKLLAFYSTRTGSSAPIARCAPSRGRPSPWGSRSTTSPTRSAPATGG